MTILIPEEWADSLAPRIHEVVPGATIQTVSEDGPPPETLKDAEVVLFHWRLGEEWLQELINVAPNLKWVQTLSAGVGYVLFPAMVKSDIILTNGSGVFDIPIAETVLAYMLTVVRDLPEFLKQQRAHEWKKRSLNELHGSTVGIVGMGSIGSEVARLAQAFGTRVLATKRHPEHGGERADRVLPNDELPELLAESDFIVITAPLTEETQHLIDAQAFEQMKPGAWLINIGRGGIVDEEALIDALREGRIAGACLDVFEEEPLPKDSPLWDLPNVIITPHNSGSTPKMEEREIDLFVENVRRYVSGDPMINVVDKQTGY